LKHLFLISLLISSSVLIGGCSSYQFGNAKSAMPGGYDRVAVPLFVNKTQEVGVEAYFTESLRTEFERSKLAKVTSKTDAQVILEGTITSVQFTPTLLVAAQPPDYSKPDQYQNLEIVAPDTASATGKSNPLPANTILSKEYQTSVTVSIVARKVSDNTVLWRGDFSGQGIYAGPLIGTPSLNASNAIYNQSSRQTTVSRIAKDMMSEAHDRLTENF
jgi:hypothetical protein